MKGLVIVDTESSQAAVEVLMRGRTTIVIAHRLSTIERAAASQEKGSKQFSGWDG